MLKLDLMVCVNNRGNLFFPIDIQLELIQGICKGKIFSRFSPSHLIFYLIDRDFGRVTECHTAEQLSKFYFIPLILLWETPYNTLQWFLVNFAEIPSTAIHNGVLIVLHDHGGPVEV